MNSRRLVVGVIGGDKNMEAGIQFGEEVTRRGWILLTGGELLPSQHVQPRGEVKEAAMLGAVKGSGGAERARLIGILPGHGAGGHQWRRPSISSLFINTSLAHNVRNVINALTPDVLVAFGGSRGTLAEIAFALAAGRRAYVHSGFARLAKHFEEFYSSASHDSAVITTYLAEPLRVFPDAARDVRELREHLSSFFRLGPPHVLDSVELASQIATNTAVHGPTGFPGLPHERGSKQEFERIVLEMSQ